jgi:hypothetical protein
MKIAVILPGHLRAWKFCKQNFVDTILHDERNEYDVFVDTYYQIFRSDYVLHKENEMNVVMTENEIRELFHNTCLIQLMVEDETTGIPPYTQKCQARKLFRLLDEIQEEEYYMGKYDLIVRTRPDIQLDKPLDYEYILEECTKNPKMIFMGDGALHWPEHNDMFGVMTSDTFRIYINRLSEHDPNDPMLHHESLIDIKNRYGIIYNQSIGISVARLDGNKNFRLEK